MKRDLKERGFGFTASLVRLVNPTRLGSPRGVAAGGESPAGWAEGEGLEMVRSDRSLP